GAVARPVLGSSDPTVLFEAGRHDDIRVFNGSRCRNLICLWSFHNQVRIPYVPAFNKNPRRRGVFRISLGCPAVRPCRQGVDLLLRERWIIVELSHAAIRMPWWHLP